MHVTLYYPGDAPIPPPLYGGTERVIYWLGKALLQLGHQVTLLANARSNLPGAELRLVKKSDVDGGWTRLVPDATDILHLWETPKAPVKKPFVITIEGNGRPGERFHANTIFVSRKHAGCHGSRHFVYNGLDPAEYRFSADRADYAVFLAKARWKVKNLAGAIQVARQAGVPLHVLGSRNWPLNLQRLLPPVRGVHYHGMVGGQQKRDLIARARCLIYPVRWEEPFGVAITEALVSGCYVAGTPYGSLPEIVSPDAGVLSASALDLIEAVRNPARFQPDACRARVLKGGFTHLDMARSYLLYYQKILSHGRLGEADEPAPATAPGFSANELLPWHD
jgi:glycosyltransferase involved in cell wall biosynthesis